MQEKGSYICVESRWKFPTLGMTLLIGTSASLGSDQQGHSSGWKLLSRLDTHIRSLYTHTLCFCPLIQKLQAFEILKWAQGSQWRKQRTSNSTREIQLIFSLQ